MLPRSLHRAPVSAALVTGLVAGLVALLPASPASAVPANAFEMPFPCGESWTGTTRSRHSPSYYSVDWNRPGDSGDPVVAAADGVISVADSVANSGYGRWVRIQHSSNENTLYAHLSSLTVRKNQTVSRGDVIGYVGSTGNSTGSHLHYEQREGSRVMPPYFSGSRFSFGTTQVSQNCASTPEEPVQTPTDTNVPLAADIVLDGRADLTVFRRLDRGTFTIRKPGSPAVIRAMGLGTDTPLMGDWDGNGRANVGLYRPSTGKFILRGGGRTTVIPLGRAGDVPIAGDWDGDGRWDVGVRRGTTFIKRMADGKTWNVSFGATDDVPITGDWNADGLTDLGVYNPGSSTFTLRILGGDWKTSTYTVRFGEPGSVAAVGDWNNDGYTDLGVWDPNTSTFHRRKAARPTGGTWSTQSIRFGRAKN